MTKTAIIVLAASDTAEGRGRIVHALTAAKELKDAGQEVGVIFEGIGVTWLTAFHKRDDQFTQTFADLFDEVRDTFIGASNYMVTKRFEATEAVAAYNVPLLGGDGGHYSLGTLCQDGYQVITF